MARDEITFSSRAGRQRIHSPKSSPLDQVSLIFVCSIDFDRKPSKLVYPIQFDRIAGFDGAACAAKKR
jgi:hypothetical protein